MGLEAARRRALELLKYRTLSLDTNIFIYALEDNSLFPVAKELFRQIPATEVRVFTSTISLVEALVPWYKLDNQEKIADTIEFITGYGRITIVNLDRTISLAAAKLRAQYRLKTPDAIQLATALLNNSDVFITADHDFNFQYIENVRIEKI